MMSIVKWFAYISDELTNIVALKVEHNAPLSLHCQYNIRLQQSIILFLTSLSMFAKSYATIYMALNLLAILAAAGPLEKRQQSATLSIFSQGGCQGTADNSIQIFQQNSCVEFSPSAGSLSLDANSQVATLQLFTGGGCGQAAQAITGSSTCISPGIQVTGVQ